MERRGFGVAPLQNPRVGALLGMPRSELLRELRFLHSDGRHFGGANAVLAVARETWWARPLVWLAAIPGVMPLLRASYSWVGSQRSCAAVTTECNGHTQ